MHVFGGANDDFLFRAVGDDDLPVEEFVEEFLSERNVLGVVFEFKGFHQARFALGDQSDSRAQPFGFFFGKLGGRDSHKVFFSSCLVFCMMKVKTI